MLYVFDTYVTNTANRIMHFDVIIPVNDEARALDSARRWLDEIGEDAKEIKSASCVFCHAVTEQQSLHNAIQKDGYAIYKLEGCPA